MSKFTDNFNMMIDMAGLKTSTKIFIDHNVWDGEDRSGSAHDGARFTPDELQELVDELIDYLFE